MTCQAAIYHSDTSSFLIALCSQNETRNEYDKVISETEAAYLKILESSQVLTRASHRTPHARHTKSKHAPTCTCSCHNASTHRPAEARDQWQRAWHASKVKTVLVAVYLRADTAHGPQARGGQHPEEAHSELISAHTHASSRCERRIRLYHR